MKSVKKVVIFETGSHQDFVYTLSVLAIKAGYDVAVFMLDEIYELALPLLEGYSDKIEWHIYPENITALKELTRYVKKNKSVLYVSSLYLASLKYLILFLKNTPKCQMYNVSGRTYLWYEKDMTKHWTRRYLRLYVMKQIQKRFSGIIIHSKEFFNYLSSKKYKKKIMYIPWYLKDIERSIVYESPESKKLSFGIVGAIQKLRRNYIEVIKEFIVLWEKGRKDISLDLIGMPIGAYGGEVIKLCKDLEQRGFPVKYSEKYLSAKEYIERVAVATFLIAPMNKEYYKNNQSSAVWTEQIRFEKPAIIPSFYKIHEFSSSTIYYKNINELQGIIENLITENKQKIYIEEAHKNALKYDFKNFIEDFKKLTSE